MARVLELEKIVKPESIKKAILAKVPENTKDLNSKAFDEATSFSKQRSPVISDSARIRQRRVEAGTALPFFHPVEGPNEAGEVAELKTGK